MKDERDREAKKKWRSFLEAKERGYPFLRVYLQRLERVCRVAEEEIIYRGDEVDWVMQSP